MTADISQPRRDNVADKGIAAKFKRTHPGIADDATREGMDDWKTILEVLHRDCKKSGRRIRPGEIGGAGEEQRQEERDLSVCRLLELCERNDVNTRLCRSSMQRLPKEGGGDAGGKISQTSERRPDKEHPRSPYVDTPAAQRARRERRGRRRRWRG